MKTKISSIMGVGLALLMVFSLAFALVPTKVEAAPSQWTPEAGPGGAGTNTVGPFDINGMAVGPDGYTIYALNAGGDTFRLVVTAASGGATPANDVLVTVGFTDATGAVALSGVTTIPGNAALGH